MKISLNPKAQQILLEVHKRFPEGTSITHVANLIFTQYANTLKLDPDEDISDENIKSK